MSNVHVPVSPVRTLPKSFDGGSGLVQSTGSVDGGTAVTLMTPSFVPPFELTFTVPSYAPTASPVVLMVTATVLASDPLSGLTVIQSWSSTTVQSSVPSPPQLVMSNVHVRVSPVGTLPKSFDGGSGLVQSTGTTTVPLTVKVPLIVGMVPCA